MNAKSLANLRVAKIKDSEPVLEGDDWVETCGKYRMDPYWKETKAERQRWIAAGRYIPSQDQIDIVCNMVMRYKGDASASEALKEFLLPFGIGIWKISKDVSVVGWLGDPLSKLILTASCEKLPEFLSSEDAYVRQLAEWRLASLTQ